MQPNCYSTLLALYAPTSPTSPWPQMSGMRPYSYPECSSRNEHRLSIAIHHATAGPHTQACREMVDRLQGCRSSRASHLQDTTCSDHSLIIDLTVANRPTPPVMSLGAPSVVYLGEDEHEGKGVLGLEAHLGIWLSQCMQELIQSRKGLLSPSWYQVCMHC